MMVSETSDTKNTAVGFILEARKLKVRRWHLAMLM